MPPFQTLDPSDLAALVTLHALLEESSVTRAARRVGLSTPAVSHALARLRERFNDPLLVRAGRVMVLTPLAQSLRGPVSAAMEQAARVFEAPHPFDPATLDRELTLSVTDYMMQIAGLRFAQRVRELAPGLRLRFIPNSTEDATRLRRGQTDLAVGIYGALPPELRARALLADRFVCAVRHDHPQVGQALTLAQYVSLGHVQIAPRGQPGGYIDEALAALGHSRRVVRAVPFFQTAMQLVAASDDVLTISERLARQQAGALGLRLLEPPLTLKPYALSMVWHPRFDGDEAHRWARERLIESCEPSQSAPMAEAMRALSATDPTGHGGAPKRRRKGS